MALKIVDSYSESNQNNLANSQDSSSWHGQSFTGDGGTLDSVKFYLKKTGSPTGNVVVKHVLGATYEKMGKLGSFEEQAEAEEMIKRYGVKHFDQWIKQQ